MFRRIGGYGFKPIAFRKNTEASNWQQHDLAAERAALVEGDNIGLLGGTPLNGGVICFGDLDFDDTPAYEAAVQVPSLKDRPQRLTGKVAVGSFRFQSRLGRHTVSCVEAQARWPRDRDGTTHNHRPSNGRCWHPSRN